MSDLEYPSDLRYTAEHEWVRTVEGDTEAGMTVDGGTANVICGNIRTANATVYVVDTVLMPKA